MVTTQKILVKGLDETIKTLQDDKKSHAEKYQAAANFFQNIAVASEREAKYQSGDWQALSRYCSQKQTQLVYYFGQCDTLHQMNKRGSIVVYQAVAETAKSVFDASSMDKVPKNLAIPGKNTVIYRDHPVAFEAKDASLSNHGVNSSFYKRINRVETYKKLLEGLEKSIVERSPGETQVRFQAITLYRSDHYDSQPGFQLKIDLTINNKVSTSVTYHFNMQTKAMYCDDVELKGISDADVVTDLKSNAKAIADDYWQIAAEGQKFVEGSAALVSQVRASINAQQTKDLRGGIKELKEQGDDPKNSNLGTTASAIK